MAGYEVSDSFALALRLVSHEISCVFNMEKLH
jgi:hypothetical protein